MNRRPPHTRDRFARRGPVPRVVRDRNRKKPDVANWIRIGLVVLLSTQCMRVAFTSPRLRLREVRVAGTERLKPEEVIRLGGIRVGQNIFSVNLVQVSKKLRSVPYVREAIVTRELPSSVHIELRERVPAFQVLSGGKVFDVDEDGVVFQKAGKVSPELPGIAVPKVPALGEKLKEDLVLAVWECDRLARSERLTIRDVRVDERGELWLNVVTPHVGEEDAGPLRVRLGRATELPQKFRDIHHSLAGWPDLTARATYLDVMCAGRPAYLRTSSN